MIDIEIYKTMEIKPELKFHSIDQFTDSIEKLVQTGGLNYLDAIMHYMDEHQLDAENIVKLLNPTLKQKLKLNADQLNLLGKKSKSKLVLADDED